MTERQLEQIATIAHDAAVEALDQPTRVVPLVRDARYCQKWVPLEDQVLNAAGEIIAREPITFAGRHLALEMLREGVREFMPLELPRGDVLAYRVDSDRLSVRACCLYVVVPADGEATSRDRRKRCEGYVGEKEKGEESLSGFASIHPSIRIELLV